MIESNMTSGPNLKRFRWPVIVCLWAFTAVALLMPAVVLAQEEDVKNDARLEGYQTKVSLESGDSTALSWLLLVFLAMVALGVMFKNAKRTHLD